MTGLNKKKINNLWQIGCFVLAGLVTSFTAQAATLASIDVTPTNATIDNGQTQAFVATGTFSDAAVRGLGSTASAITGGMLHTCSLMSDKSVRCWGQNHYGQLGDGSTTNSSVPVFVNGLNNVTAVSAGGTDTCALLDYGSVKCWGDNTHGQLGGRASASLSMSPVTVDGISTATSIAAGYEHNCALLSDGTVKCWGNNDSGQIGNGKDTHHVGVVSGQGNWERTSQRAITPSTYVP